MRILFGGSKGIRTIIFPSALRTVRQAAFYGVKSLRKAALNEGLEVLGTDEVAPSGKWYPGVFYKSGLKYVKFPSTMKRVECCTFTKCKKLRAIELPDGLEYLGKYCF